MVPGPVSDSYDPEFGTGANAREVAEAMREVLARVGHPLGPGLHPILQVVRGPNGKRRSMAFSERDLRIIRFGLHRALESI